MEQSIERTTDRKSDQQKKNDKELVIERENEHTDRTDRKNK